MFYGIGETLDNAISLLYTKLIWKNARLIRRPFYARNRKNIVIKDGFTTGRFCRVTAGVETKVKFGKNFVMGDMCQLEGSAGIEIGDNVLFASRIFLGTTSHGKYTGEKQSNPNQPPNEREIDYKPIKIGNNVWVGNEVSILGVTIGDGAVIGANSVVTHDVPENSMVAGVPAKIIKKYNFELEKWEKTEDLK